MHIIVDLLLLAALAEQIVVEAGRSSLLPFLIVFFILAAFVRFYCTPSTLNRFTTPPLSLLFAIGCLGELLFVYMILADERLYSWLFGESSAAISAQEIGIWITLICFFVAGWRGSVAGGRAFLCSVVLIGSSLLVWCLTARGEVFADAPLLNANESTNFLVILAILCARVVFSSPHLGKSKLQQMWMKCELGSIALVGLSLTFFLLWSLILVVRRPLNLEAFSSYKVPSEFLAMLLISEDPIFSFHRGVDFKRLRDAVREFNWQGEYGRGGSTLTMQLAKIKYLTSEKTLLRKVKQIGIAFWLDALYPKHALLWEYIHTVPFGPGAIGLLTASKQVFAREPSELSAQQSILLVLSIYNPLQFNASMSTVPNVVRNRGFVIKSRVRRNSSRILTRIAGMPFVIE